MTAQDSKVKLYFILSIKALFIYGSLYNLKTDSINSEIFPVWQKVKATVISKDNFSTEFDLFLYTELLTHTETDQHLADLIYDSSKVWEYCDRLDSYFYYKPHIFMRCLNHWVQHWIWLMTALVISLCAKAVQLNSIWPFITT